MKILYTAYECAPFYKHGGLGDVAEALPKAIKKLNQDIRVFMPYYNFYIRYKDRIKFVKRFNFIFAGQNEEIKIHQSFLPDSKVPIYFIENKKRFGREKVFLYRKKRAAIFGHDDDNERFMFFCRAVLESLKIIQWKPDLIHFNDWHTCAIPLYLNILKKTDPHFKDIKTLLTIHNLGYQGTGKLRFNLNGLKKTDFKYQKRLNLMAEGILQSDYINAVSKQYAKEILTKEYGRGLEKFLRSRKNRLTGILNGLDYETFNPQTDKYLHLNYSLKTIDRKLINKKYLQNKLGLPIKPETPILSLVSRLVEQKGLELLIPVLKKLAKSEMQFVLIGVGRRKYEKAFKKLAKKHPQKISANIKFDLNIAQEIYAGSDIFLMPSKYEPCGLGQMIAMKYGTLPLVRETGGLKDTVSPKIGFLFKRYNEKALFNCLKQALNLYYNNKPAWQKRIRLAMKQNFSWHKSAKKYLKLYQRIQEK